MQQGIVILWMLAFYTSGAHFLAKNGHIPIAPKYLLFLGLLMFIWGFFRKEIDIHRATIPFLRANVVGILLTIVFYLLLMINPHRMVDFSATNNELGVILFYLMCIVAVIVFSYERAFPLAKYLLVGLFFFSSVMNFFDLGDAGETISSNVSGRAAGLYGNPNLAGLVLSISYVLIHKDIGKSFRLMTYVIFSAAVFSTFSRAAIVYIAIITLYLLLTGYFFKWNKKSIAINAFVILSVVASWAAIQQQSSKVFTEVLSINQSIETRIENFKEIFTGDESSIEKGKKDGRFSLMIGHFRHFMNRPVLGNGIGFSRSPSLTGFENPSHNTYIHMMNEFGLFGLIFYLYFLYRIFGVSILRFKKTNYEPQLLFLIIFFAGFFNHGVNRNYAIALLFSYACVKYTVFHEYRKR